MWNHWNYSEVSRRVLRTWLRFRTTWCHKGSGEEEEEDIAEDKGEEGKVEKRCLRVWNLMEEQKGLVCDQMPAAEGPRGLLGLIAKKSEAKGLSWKQVIVAQFVTVAVRLGFEETKISAFSTQKTSVPRALRIRSCCWTAGGTVLPLSLSLMELKETDLWLEERAS